jgi:hypothetical protein
MGRSSVASPNPTRQQTSGDRGRSCWTPLARRSCALRSAMKKFVTVFCLGASLAGVSAQGLINFFNNSSAPITSGPPYSGSVIPGIPGSYFFGLLTSPVGANTFTFSGVYGTNQAVAGLFSGGVGVPVPGWAPGTASDFEVIGWSSLMGHDYDPRWLNGPWYVGEPLIVGHSAIGTGVAGGVSSSGTLRFFHVWPQWPGPSEHDRWIEWSRGPPNPRLRKVPPTN